MGLFFGRTRTFTNFAATSARYWATCYVTNSVFGWPGQNRRGENSNSDCPIISQFQRWKAKQASDNCGLTLHWSRRQYSPDPIRAAEEIGFYTAQEGKVKDWSDERISFEAGERLERITGVRINNPATRPGWLRRAGWALTEKRFWRA